MIARLPYNKENGVEINEQDRRLGVREKAFT